MRYQGGKGRTGTHIAPIVLREAAGLTIHEPFCGGLGMTKRILPKTAGDASLPVLTLVNAVRGGWRPPVHVTESEYARVAALPRDEANQLDPYYCFVGQCCTFGGKWFGGYARAHGDSPSPIRAAQKSLIAKVKATMETEFYHGAYDSREYGKGDAVYCDPPYAGTSANYPTAKFDHEAFWRWVGTQADCGAVMLVSEFSAPEWVTEVWSKEAVSSTRHADDRTVTERLYRVGPSTSTAA